MAVFSSDDFVATDATELSVHDSKWVKVTGFGIDGVIYGNRVRPQASGSAVYRTTDAPSSADYSVSVVTVFNATTGVPGSSALGRVSSSASTYYAYGPAEISAIMGTSLTKRVSGSNTSLGRDTTGTYTGSRTYILDMSGTTIRGLDNGVQIFSVTDSSISSDGFPGINVSGTSRLDSQEVESFSAEESGGGAVTLLPSSISSAEAFGTAVIVRGNVNVLVSSISSTETFGNHTISNGTLSIVPSGIASAQAFGTAQILRGVRIVAPTSIASAQAFGTGSILRGTLVIYPNGIPSGELFGLPTVTGGIPSVATSVFYVRGFSSFGFRRNS